MTLMVHSLGGYASYPGGNIPWRPADYDIYKLVKSIKSETFRGYSQVRDVRGNWHRIEMGIRAPALTYFAQWAIQRLRDLSDPPLVLIPLPSSNCVDFTTRSAPNDMAEAIRNLAPPGAIQIRRCLRFDRPMMKSHEGGTRNPDVIRERLVASTDVQQLQRSRVVLIDDVKTTGGHIRACAVQLRLLGIEVPHAMVAASTVWEQVENPFNIPTVDLEPPIL